MKKNYISILALLIAFISCGDDNTPEDNSTQNNGYSDINKWIYKNMQVYYLWNEHIPEATLCDFTSYPERFFNSVCHTYDKTTNPDGDRFSWIQENYVDLLNSLGGISNDELGFEFILYYLDNNGSELIGEVLYVKKGTPAEKNNLKRGQFFTKVNGTQLTINNYKQIFSGIKGDYALTVYDGDDNYLMKKKIYSLSTVSKYEENPIYLDTVYQVNGKKVAYLVYNFFADDNGDDKCGYDAQLAGIFEKFKTENVTSLILDLRYNSGGSTLAATVLGSMITKDFNTGNVFYKIKYNSLLTKEFEEEEGQEIFNRRFIDKITSNKSSNKLTSPIPLTNIGNNLEHFFILTGNHTASASELIINGLKPYMQVTILGNTTVGKNVASISIYEENNPKNKWGMQPIIAKMFNKNDESDFTAGFSPDIKNLDTKYPKKDLGDIEENMLNEALQNITGYTGLRSGNINERQTNTIPVGSSLDNKVWKNKSVLKNISIQKLIR